MSVALLVLVSTPAILRRGADEERLLLQKFGREHEECQRRTWFQARSWCSRNTRIQQTAMSK